MVCTGLWLSSHFLGNLHFPVNLCCILPMNRFFCGKNVWFSPACWFSVHCWGFTWFLAFKRNWHGTFPSSVAPTPWKIPLRHVSTICIFKMRTHFRGRASRQKTMKHNESHSFRIFHKTFSARAELMYLHWWIQLLYDTFVSTPTMNNSLHWIYAIHIKRKQNESKRRGKYLECLPSSKSKSRIV